MADIVDRVRKLIQLAASSSEEEARSSAYLACKLIREHKLEIRGPDHDLRDIFLQAMGVPEYQRAAQRVARPTSPTQPRTAAPPPRRSTVPPRWEEGDPFSWMDPRNRPSPSQAPKPPIEEDPDLDAILREAASKDR